MSDDLNALLSGFKLTRLLVIGDVMLDDYLVGPVNRLSPEAPIPVVQFETRDLRAGGAANAALNAADLGGTVTLLGLVGADEPGLQLRGLVKKHGVNDALIEVADRSTTRKLRVLAERHQLVRVDFEDTTPLDEGQEFRVVEAIDSLMAEADAVLLSDYDKGLFTPTLVRHILDTATQQGIPTVVDPKQAEFAMYRGATVCTPNVAEAQRALLPHAGRLQAIEGLGAALVDHLEGSVLITRGAEGMTLFRPGQDPLHIATRAVRIFDVTGAGDSVAATVALALGSGAGLEQAALLATASAHVVVGKPGTSTASPGEIRMALLDQ